MIFYLEEDLLDVLYELIRENLSPNDSTQKYNKEFVCISA